MRKHLSHVKMMCLALGSSEISSSDLEPLTAITLRYFDGGRYNWLPAAFVSSVASIAYN
jgi:hypothetical protein